MVKYLYQKSLEQGGIQHEKHRYEHAVPRSGSLYPFSGRNRSGAENGTGKAAIFNGTTGQSSQENVRTVQREGPVCQWRAVEYVSGLLQ